MKKNKSLCALITVLFFIFPMNMLCQNLLQGYVKGKGGSGLVGASITILKGGKLLAYSSTDSKGKYTINNIPSGKYDISVSCVGMESHEESLDVNGDMKRNFLLAEGNIELDSVVVSARRPSIRTSKGHIYFLSKEAVASGDPYIALREIPELISNSTTQSVSSKDGKSLVVLIDGMRVNTGITPISPDRIESVEIIDVAGAKYMHDGGEKILNIHTKKHFPPYLYVQESVRDDIPAYWQFFDSQFEIGNPKSSFYGKFVLDGGHDNKTYSDFETQTSSYKRTESSITKSCNRSASFDLMMKAKPAKDTYLAFYITGEKSKEHSSTSGNGLLDNTGYGTYSTSGLSRYKSDILSGNLYLYKKTKKGSFDGTLWGSLNNSNTGNEMFQDFATHDWHGRNDIKVNTHTFGEKFDYTFDIKGIEANAGNVTTYSRYKMEDKTGESPLYRHDRFCEYVYFGLSGKLARINYQLSAGYDFVWMRSSGIINRYHEPRLSLSADKDLTKEINLGLEYTQNINAPEISGMNPYNTSSDSLIYSSGNPYLLPSILRSTALRLSYSKNSFNSFLSGTYSRTSKSPEAVAYVDNYGIYHSSIENRGHAGNLDLTANASYYKNGTMINLKYSYVFDYFQGMPAKKHYNLCFMLFGKLGPINYTLSSSYNNRSYSPISTTSYKIPSVGLTASYQPDREWTITVGMTGFGRSKTVTATKVQGYDSFKTSRNNAVYPFILVRWTLRKNMKRKINLENVQFMRDSDEKIKL